MITSKVQKCPFSTNECPFLTNFCRASKVDLMMKGESQKSIRVGILQNQIINMKNLVYSIITMFLFSSSMLQAQTYQIGDEHPDGGIVFMITDGGKSGMIAATQKSPTPTNNWDAAKEYCENLGDGWRMPSKDEMLIMADKITIAAGTYFWTSTHQGTDEAFIVLLQGGIKNWPSGKSSDKNFVRAVRPFRHNWLIPFGDVSCTQHLKTEFSCSCSFSTGDPYNGPVIFASDWGKNACVNIDDPWSSGMNALYPDWEERDYKAELKKLSESTNWIEANGDYVSFFGKSLASFKYENATEFLIDVILASGRDIEVIPMASTTGGPSAKAIAAQAKEAVAQAKEYKRLGGDDPLTIVKYDNRSYDVFVRYRKITQYEGEANQHEGTVTLLKNRSEEILDTKNVKGTCGC